MVARSPSATRSAPRGPGWCSPWRMSCAAAAAATVSPRSASAPAWASARSSSASSPDTRTNTEKGANRPPSGIPRHVQGGEMTRNVAFILFPGAEELDFAGPWEVYTMTNAIVPDAVRAYVVSEDGGTVACAKGMRVEADYSFANAPKADVAVVPGGLATRQEVDNPAIIEFIRAQDATSELTTSVCTGALLL